MQSLNNLSGFHSAVKPDPALQHQGVCLARKLTAWVRGACLELDHRCGSWLDKGEVSLLGERETENTCAWQVRIMGHLGS